MLINMSNSLDYTVRDIRSIRSFALNKILECFNGRYSSFQWELDINQNYQVFLKALIIEIKLKC